MNEPDPQYKEFAYNRELQREQLDKETSLNAPYLLQQQRDVQAALLEQLDPNRIIEEIKLTLRGKIKDAETGEIKDESEPLMNELGIGRIIAYIRGVVNQNTIMSSLDELTIKKIMKKLTDDICDDLLYNWKEYGIKYKTDLDRIENICAIMAYTALMRCMNAGERGFLGRTTVETINSAIRQGQEKKGNLLSKFKL